MEHAKQSIESSGAQSVTTYLADFSNLSEVEKLCNNLIADFDRLDVIINNAGVYKTSNPIKSDNMDVRFVVNILAPALLTFNLITLLGENSRVINVSSAAQESVNLDALVGKIHLS